MSVESKSENSISQKNVYEEITNLKNDFSILKSNIIEETKFLEMKKEENLDLVDANFNEMCNNGYIEGKELLDNSLFDSLIENKTNNKFSNVKIEQDVINEEQNVLENEMNINITYESDEHIKGKTENLKISEIDSSINGTKEEKSEDIKMKIKIQNLLKLVGLLKSQINKKDDEIYKMEVDLKLKKEKDVEENFNLSEFIRENDDIVEKGGEDFIMHKMKNILLSQNEEIKALNEELKKKSKEIFYLNEENSVKSEKLAELKKEIETNYMYIKEYKHFQKELEFNVNNKIYNAENYLNITNQKLKENNINLKEKDLNIERQKRVINELNNELKKKEMKICKLKDILENIELNNNRDIIKYKQSNTDLINRLSLNNSLMNNQKIEIENMHMNYKQLDEELKNKDNELKKLHKNLLAKDEEINKNMHDINRLKFDLEIRNINIINIKKKIKAIKKEYSIHLKKQKERYISVINQIYKEKDEIIKNHNEELSKLTQTNNEIIAHNENMKNELNILNDKLIKKSAEFEKVQDALLDCESKLLIYENNNEIKILKKNEDHLRKLLNKHIYRNEQLLNTTFLLQKSTLENNSLEKKIIELKAKTYMKDQEIKRLQETRNKGKPNDNSNNDKIKEILDNNINNLNQEKYASISRNANNNNHMRSLLDNTNENETNESFKSDREDPVSLALHEYRDSYKRSNIPFKVKKINKNNYLLNDKRVVIKFINGDLYVEDDAYPVKLQDYLLKNYTF